MEIPSPSATLDELSQQLAGLTLQKPRYSSIDEFQRFLELSAETIDRINVIRAAVCCAFESEQAYVDLCDYNRVLDMVYKGTISCASGILILEGLLEHWPPHYVRLVETATDMRVLELFMVDMVPGFAEYKLDLPSPIKNIYHAPCYLEEVLFMRYSECRTLEGLNADDVSAYVDMCLDMMERSRMVQLEENNSKLQE